MYNDTEPVTRPRVVRESTLNGDQMREVRVHRQVNVNVVEHRFVA